MDEIEEPVEPVELGPMKTLDMPDEHVMAVDAEKRILGLRVVRYNEVVDHPAYGRMMFLQGAFLQPTPGSVRLRMDHQNPPTGVNKNFRDEPDAPYIDFQVSKTARGDEQLTLARDGTSRGTSPGFADVPGKPQQKLVGGKLTTVYGPGSAVLLEVSTTWSPTFSGDGVVYVLSNEQQQEEAPVAENDTPATAAVDYDRLTAAIIAAGASPQRDHKIDTMLEKFESMVEMQRAQFSLSAVPERKPLFKDWFGVTLRMLAGARVSDSELKELALDDVVTTEQPGLVPAVFTPDYNDIIRTNRPFLSSTREVRPPATGSTMTLPIITTRAVAGSQAGNAEKGALTTTAPKVGTGAFAAKYVFAGADISIQMILRADRSFLDLLDQEFIEAYALDMENKALAALIAGYTDSGSVNHAPTNGGVLDPEDPHFGEAWANSISSTGRRAPTHIWMNSAAVGAFIDAKAPITNAPLYSNLAADFTAANGTGGKLSGLIPVYVPAMDDEAYDVIVGPSSGFVWAEDPAVRLQADAPAVAGRDIVLAGTLFPAPRYADAFTKYTIAS